MGGLYGHHPVMRHLTRRLMLRPTPVLANGPALRRRLVARDEEGVFLVIYALALVLIMLLAALAIDFGNITQTKQHAQNAADDAALSAVGDLAPIASGVPAATQEQLAVDDVESFVQRNYPSITATDWNDCPDTALPPNVTSSTQVQAIANSSHCIGFFNPLNAASNVSDPTGLAVVIPGQTVDYTFGKAGGLTSQGISAVAEASVQNPGAQFLLPFGYAPGGGAGLQCLKTGSGNKAAACTGFAIGSGQFGVLDSPRYRICFGSCPLSSNGAGNNAVVMGDIDLGIDHRLNIFPTTPPPPPAPAPVDICDATGPPPNCAQYNDVATGAAPFDDANNASPLTGQTLNDPGPALFNADQNSFVIGGCTIDTPRFNHPDGFQATGSCASDNGSPSYLVNGSSATVTCPCLSLPDSFGSSRTLNGVHITNYLVGGTASPQFAACYTGSGLPTGIPSPDPSSQAIDATTATGANAWSGTPTTEDGCLSNEIQQLSSACPTLAPPAPSTSCSIFSSAITSSPRFGIVPVVASGNGRGSERIEGFLGVYLDMASGTGTKVDAITAWVFPLDLIQPSGTGSGSGLGSYSGGPFVANLCSLQVGNC